jgi:hypothetical protein
MNVLTDPNTISTEIPKDGGWSNIIELKGWTWRSKIRARIITCID